MGLVALLHDGLTITKRTVHDVAAYCHPSWRAARLGKDARAGAVIFEKGVGTAEGVDAVVEVGLGRGAVRAHGTA
jgi:hypothetical protein